MAFPKGSPEAVYGLPKVFPRALYGAIHKGGGGWKIHFDSIFFFPRSAHLKELCFFEPPHLV